MGFFDRFRRVVKSNLNEMISKAEDPERMLNQVINDMNAQLIESKKSVAAAIADEKRLERQMRQQFALSEEWEQKAVAFVKAGRDDSAKEALLRKQEYQNLAQQYKEQYEAQHASVLQLKTTLRQLQQKIEEAVRKKSLLIARAKRAKAQQDIQKHISSMSDKSAFEAFDQMASKVERLEAETEAMAEIGKLDQDVDPLEAEFRALESSDSTADKMLEDLKKKISGEIEAPREERKE